MNGFKPLSFTPDSHLLQISQLDVFSSNSIELLVPFLKSILFGDFQPIFSNSSPEMQFRLLQLTQLTAQYFYFQALQETPQKNPNNQADSVSLHNYQQLQVAYQQLQKENEALKQQNITPAYYKNMIAIKLANDQIRAENFKLKERLAHLNQQVEYKCEECGKYFANAEYLQKHQGRRHNIAQEEGHSATATPNVQATAIHLQSSNQRDDKFEPLTISKVSSKQVEQKTVAQSAGEPQRAEQAINSVQTVPKQATVAPNSGVQTEKMQTLINSEQPNNEQMIKLLDSMLKKYEVSQTEQEKLEANSIGQIE